MKVNHANDNRTCVSCGHKGYMHKWMNQNTGEWYYGDLCAGGSCPKCRQHIACDCKQFRIRKGRKDEKHR